jgi:hypothetical protein
MIPELLVITKKLSQIPTVPNSADQLIGPVQLNRPNAIQLTIRISLVDIAN